MPGTIGACPYAQGVEDLFRSVLVPALVALVVASWREYWLGPRLKPRAKRREGQEQARLDLEEAVTKLKSGATSMRMDIRIGHSTQDWLLDHVSENLNEAGRLLDKTGRKEDSALAMPVAIASLSVITMRGTFEEKAAMPERHRELLIPLLESIHDAVLAGQGGKRADNNCRARDLADRIVGLGSNPGSAE